ncbi:phosphate/phosphite/phosphonate ABC transporter substrate-binding protein [Dinghuibacter silviterrae]|uniref:Phosphonate transport system substrate-binding protein n=1 Tax=Dinghuibacter silviterrae TaxID=1539049 RepID=A0A4R8DUK7_9BACT|nr:phosphate/phosphite/phosphonate ABC transporter substrate-binding protein [Dinghuibacter silviterrae]TDX00841.1 phosphonate transport system substrate-binding protein [Dinghuibacter silviterrae]
MKKLIGAAIVLLALAGCRSKQALDANGVPYTLLVGIYEGDNPGEQTRVLDPIREYLSRKLGRPVEFLTSSDYTSVIEALLTKKVHMAYLSPFPYVLATQKQKLIPLVAAGLNGKPAMYRSIIFTSPSTGLHSMEDVRRRSHSLTLCFADPASTSGHLVPAAYLNSIGLDPKTAFKESMFAGSHVASMLSVKSGKIDVGCSFEYGYQKLIRENTIKPEDLTILWTSDPIVENPIAMRTDINPEFAEKVKQAYINMQRDAPEAAKGYFARYQPKQADSLGYMAISDTAFDGLRKLMKDAGDITTDKQ